MEEAPGQSSTSLKEDPSPEHFFYLRGASGYVIYLLTEKKAPDTFLRNLEQAPGSVLH